MRWSDVEFISDVPGKNEMQVLLDGGGRTSAALTRLLQSAERRVVIQSPYLVVSDEALALLQQLHARGVEVRINTNSLASTDNLPAFSGYCNQRARLLAMGLRLYDYKPAPKVQQQLMQRLGMVPRIAPILSLHAKTMVIDGKAVFIGTSTSTRARGTSTPKSV